jgi:hypothetical protein
MRRRGYDSSANAASWCPWRGKRSFQQEARVSRIVAEDYLVSLATNRYSVPLPPHRPAGRGAAPG